MSDVAPGPPPSQGAVKSEGNWKIFVAAFAGALGSALAGLIVSATTLNSVLKIFAGEKLPNGSVILVKEDDCGGSNSDWKPLSGAGGHFIVVSDNAGYRASQMGEGAGEKVNIEKKNLPNISLNITYDKQPIPTNLNFIKGNKDVNLFGDGAETKIFSLGGEGVPLTVRPRWIALTACAKK